ncbi:MAG: PaaI family thioesterase [Phycisphaerae bacterium]|nr:PaaI family thioesterase [Phycisphaerae bacterium]
MTPKDPDYQTKIGELFHRAAFVRDVGIELADVGPGWCETTLALRPKHFQQDNVVHAGVEATIADHTAGAAGNSLVGADKYVLTAEFKINFLRPARGERLSCRAEVLKAGRTLIVVESEVFSHEGDAAKLVAKAVVTLAVLQTNQDD